jgi:cytochrome c553
MRLPRTGEGRGEYFAWRGIFPACSGRLWILPTGSRHKWAFRVLAMLLLHVQSVVRRWRVRTMTLLTVACCVGFAANAAAQDKVALGEKVFADQKCSLCHSIGEKGNKKGPLDSVGKLAEADIRAWITDAKGMTAKTKAVRKPEMKAYSLPKDDVDHLVAYLQTLKK